MYRTVSFDKFYSIRRLRTLIIGHLFTRHRVMRRIVKLATLSYISSMDGVKMSTVGAHKAMLFQRTTNSRLRTLRLGFVLRGLLQRVNDDLKLELSEV